MKNFILIFTIFTGNVVFADATPCVDDANNLSVCRTSPARYVTPSLGSSITGANGVKTVSIPLGFYDGTTTVSGADTNLVAGKIKSGVNIFGVVGTLNAAFAACSDNSLNAGQCTTAVNRYVTSSLGSNLNSANGNLSITIPVGFYNGATTATVNDTNLVATNIRTGTNIFGTVGSLNEAFATCTDDASNAAQCSTAVNRYVTGTLGANFSGANGNIAVTIPSGFYNGTTTAAVSDTNLIAGNIRTGTNIFGTTGTADPTFSGCTDNALNAGQCSTATNRYVTATLGANVSGTAGNISVTIPLGFQNGTKTASVNDGDLVAGNIKTGVDLFGVTGTLDEAFTACTDDANNAAQCSTATSRYVTGTLGGNVTGTDGSLTATVPLGFQNGTKTVSVTDSDLVASNIKNTVDIFGVTGNLAAPYANCTDDSNNAGQCSTASGRYVTGTLGANVSGTAGSITATIPTGFQNGTKTASVSDADLTAANIKNGVTIFGVTGTTNVAFSGCTDDANNVGQCSTATNRYVSATNGANVSGANGNISVTVPQAFQDGTHTASVSDTDLVASNIKNGVVIFGVTGSKDAAFSGCTDDGNNAGQCSTATNRYVSATNGANISGADGSLTASISTSFQDGTHTASVSDTDLVAGNILTGTNIFGVAGSLIQAYSDCTDDAFNAGKCSTATNRYVTSTAGSDVTVSGGTSATIPLGFYTGKSCLVSDANLIAANIKLGVAILGVNGSITTYAPSNMNRSKTQAQITQLSESETSAGSAYTNSSTGYRAVPRITVDDDGYSSGNVTKVNRTGWGATTCGTAQTTLAARIADCASVFGAEATWDGTVKGNAGHGVWKLVTRSADLVVDADPAFPQYVKGREVWQDQRTKLLWSSKISPATTFCKASGSNNIPGNPVAEDDPSNFCDRVPPYGAGNEQLQNDTGKAISACFEDGDVNFTMTDGSVPATNHRALDSAGKAGLGLSSSPAVFWRLPTRGDYDEADNNGLRFVMPDMIGNPGNFTLYSGIMEWTANVVSSSTNVSDGYTYWGYRGGFDYNPRGVGSRYGARCVGRTNPGN